MPRRQLIGALMALLIALASLAGCGSSPGPSPFTAIYPAATAGLDPLPISLVDQTGLVTGIAVASAEAASPGVEAVPGTATTLRATWQGGPCDDRATLVLNALGGDLYELAIHNHPPITAGISCDATTILRTVDIAFDRQLDPSQLTLNVTYP